LVVVVVVVVVVEVMVVVVVVVGVVVVSRDIPSSIIEEHLKQMTLRETLTYPPLLFLLLRW